MIVNFMRLSYLLYCTYGTKSLILFNLTIYPILVHKYKRKSMKSSFKKVDKSNHNSQKCFFGHPQLDAVLNNSLSKGHIIAIQ